MGVLLKGKRVLNMNTHTHNIKVSLFLVQSFRIKRFMPLNHKTACPFLSRLLSISEAFTHFFHMCVCVCLTESNGPSESTPVYHDR